MAARICKYAGVTTEPDRPPTGLRAEHTRVPGHQKDMTMAETENTAPKPVKAARKSATPPATPKAPQLAADQGNGAASAATASPTKTIVAKAKETTSQLATEAVSAARNAANEGKDRASEALNSVSKAVEGAASLVEDKVGPSYGIYARKAADQVAGLAQTLQSKDIDDLIEDTRTFVRKQPMVAIGAAAAIGFVLTRLVKIGGSDRDTGA